MLWDIHNSSLQSCIFKNFIWKHLSSWKQSKTNKRTKQKRSKTKNLWTTSSTVSYAGPGAKWFDVEWRHSMRETGEGKEAKMRLCSPTLLWPGEKCWSKKWHKVHPNDERWRAKQREGKRGKSSGKLPRWRICRAALLQFTHTLMHRNYSFVDCLIKPITLPDSIFSLQFSQQFFSSKSALLTNGICITLQKVETLSK